MARSTATRKESKRHSSKEPFSITLFLIALFKLFKALLLIAVGLGAIKLLHKDLSDTVLHWVQALHMDSDNRYIHGFLVRVFRVTPKQLKELSAGTFIYAALFATEGTGLLLRKRWAEYFTIITTGALLPFEIYAMAKHFTLTRFVVTAINALIVWYLIARVRSRSKR